MRRVALLAVMVGLLSCVDGAVGGALGGIAARPLALCFLNCKGCCDDNDTCQAGTDVGNCGTGGSRCVVCPGVQLCGADISGNGGSCEACSSTNCPGCCDDDGACQAGTSDAACGLFQCEVCGGVLHCEGHICQ